MVGQTILTKFELDAMSKKDRRLESLVDFREVKPGRIFVVQSPVRLKKKEIRIHTPPGVDLYAGPYQKGRFRHPIFGVRGNSPVILSIVNRDDVNELGHVVLADIDWLNSLDTLKVYRRIIGRYETVTFNGCTPIRGNYPFA